jgi:hypothetical protein
VVRYKAALYGHLGNTAAGQKYVRDLLRRFPGITVKSVEQNMNVNTGAWKRLLAEGLRKAPLPEE